MLFMYLIAVFTTKPFCLVVLNYQTQTQDPTSDDLYFTSEDRLKLPAFLMSSL